MKYYIDTEFIEGFHKPFLGKRRHFIDLISIGIVAEDGREYYAISNEFNPKDASEWVQKNVLRSLSAKTGWKNNLIYGRQFVFGDDCKSNNKIAKEIIDFVNPDLMFSVEAYNNSELKDEGRLGVHFNKHNVTDIEGHYVAQPEFYGYYGDYDWVLFCSIFGTMMQIPKGFPMYLRDIKQIVDEKVNAMTLTDFNILRHIMPGTVNYEHFSFKPEQLDTFKKKLDMFKCDTRYPKEENAHNALDDAKWNKKLHEFILSL